MSRFVPRRRSPSSFCQGVRLGNVALRSMTAGHGQVVNAMSIHTPSHLKQSAKKKGVHLGSAEQHSIAAGYGQVVIAVSILTLSHLKLECDEN